MNGMKMKNIALIFGITLFAACDEGLYTVDENADKPPIVNLREDGTRDILMRDSTGTRTALSAAERRSMIYPWDNASTIYPSNFPYFRFNKLMDGSTIETLRTDELAKKEIGNCGPIPGAIEVLEDGVAVQNLRTCYSPSDKLVGIQIANAPVAPAVVGTPKLFLKYNTDYRYRVTSNIKDKKGAALEDFTANFRVSPFTLLVVSDASKISRLYADGTGSFAALAPDAAEVTAPVQQLRFVFSGPMTGPVATAALRNVKLLDSNDVEVTATDTTTNEIISASAEQNANTTDAREVLLTVPQAILDGDAGELPPGDYKLVFPVTVTDNGAVMGTSAAPVPVPLAEEIVVPFTVLPAEEQ